VRTDETPWTADELAELTAELQADKARLSAEIAEAESDLEELIEDSSDSSGDDQADAGGKTFDREHEFSLANNTRDLLIQTLRALDRLADGTYGVCESCGKPIGKARLQAAPRATLCVPCKQREERR
jgi:DnaK suppressor protein